MEEFDEYIMEMFEKSFANYGAEFSVGRDEYLRIFLDGVKTGIAKMMMEADKISDRNRINKREW